MRRIFMSRRILAMLGVAWSGTESLPRHASGRGSVSNLLQQDDNQNGTYGRPPAAPVAAPMYTMHRCSDICADVPPTRRWRAYAPVAPSYSPFAVLCADDADDAPVAPTYAPVAPMYAPMAPTYAAPVAPSYAPPAAPAYAPPVAPSAQASGQR